MHYAMVNVFQLDTLVRMELFVNLDKLIVEELVKIFKQMMAIVMHVEQLVQLVKDVLLEPALYLVQLVKVFVEPPVVLEPVQIHMDWAQYVVLPIKRILTMVVHLHIKMSKDVVQAHVYAVFVHQILRVNATAKI